ncbi:MAG: FGGY family carbohydrate kinase [Candidatus Geothermincolia bacterium]
MGEKYILVNDVGTTGTRGIIFDHESNIISESYTELPQVYPKPGWTEQDPQVIFDLSVEVCRKAIEQAGIRPEQISAMGIATQRATSLFWDRKTGEPLYNAITWQDTRQTELCDQINKSGLFKILRMVGGTVQGIASVIPALKKSGVGKMLITAAHLSLTPAQSSAHARWVIDNVKGAEKKIKAGDALFGTIDSWMIWKYTGGTVHATDFSNVSATGMFDPFSMGWSSVLIKAFKLPFKQMKMPEIRDTSGDFGHTDVFGAEIPITAVVADQQSALFGEGCFDEGSVKITNGTGTFIDMNTGDKPMASVHALTPFIAWSIKGQPTFMMEGFVSSTGAAIQWLKDGLGIINDARETEDMANSVEDTGSVYVVPAFTGLTAPYWDPGARGTVIGLSRSSSKQQVVRATLESIAYQCRDIVLAMQEDTDTEILDVKADGGASANNFLLQFMSDLLGARVERPKNLEGTALGAAYLAGLAVGYWETKEDILKNRQVDRNFSPGMADERREELYAGWKRAVERACRWA